MAWCQVRGWLTVAKTGFVLTLISTLILIFSTPWEDVFELPEWENLPWAEILSFSWDPPWSEIIALTNLDIGLGISLFVGLLSAWGGSFGTHDPGWGRAGIWVAVVGLFVLTVRIFVPIILQVVVPVIIGVAAQLDNRRRRRRG